MYYCYILYSKDIDQTYTGYTKDLERRVRQHVQREDSTVTTKRADDYKLIWYAAFKDEYLAKEFERYLKSHSGRAFMKKRLIGKLLSISNSSSEDLGEVENEA